MNGPNPIRVARSMTRALTQVRRPAPAGGGETVDHSALAPILRDLSRSGDGGLAEAGPGLDRYLAQLATLRPNELSPPEALAFWINLYNAGALRIAAKASAGSRESVLRVPGAFDRPFVEVDGEKLSLDAIEHAKVRRFRDPRIHAALVCGSVSCPTLRSTPYQGGDLDSQLDEQMRWFLASGGAVATAEALMLSRVFLWYGADFVRPRRMPSLLPVRRRSVAAALAPWMPPDTVAALTPERRIEFQPYDWGLRCAVR